MDGIKEATNGETFCVHEREDSRSKDVTCPPTDVQT